MNSVGIVGFGRFGKILANILQKGFAIKAYDPKPTGPSPGVQFSGLDTVLMEKVIFIAVPIRYFEKAIIDISQRINQGTTLIDVCSVKKYPVDVMMKVLPKHVGIIATHPMFGPDSYISNSNLKMMINNTRDSNNEYSFWKRFSQIREYK